MSRHLHPLPISIFIITLNEERRLKNALSSVQNLSDDVVIVDSGSTDGTIQIARDFGAKCITRNFTGYGDQKKFAESQCLHDWVFNIDADEIVSEELANSIRSVFKKGIPELDGLRVAQTDVPAGRMTVPPFAYYRWPVRLYKRSHGSFNPSPVHDVVDMDPRARIGKLKGALLHHSFLNFRHQIDKLNRYSTMQAQDYVNRHRPPSILRAWTEFPLSFLKSYFLRRYIFQGLYGYFIALNYAHYRTIRIAKMYEILKLYDDNDV